MSGRNAYDSGLVDGRVAVIVAIIVVHAVDE